MFLTEREFGIKKPPKVVVVQIVCISRTFLAPFSPQIYSFLGK